MMVMKDVQEIWCVEVTTVESLVCTITLKTTVVMNPPLSQQRGYLLLSFQGFPWTLLQVMGSDYAHTSHLKILGLTVVFFALLKGLWTLI